MSSDYFLVNEARTVLKQTQKLESEGNLQAAAKAYRRAADLYATAAQKATDKGTRDIYMKHAAAYRQKADVILTGRSPQTPQGGVSGSSDELQELDRAFAQKAETFIARSTATWDDISGLVEAKRTVREAVAIARSRPEKDVRLEPSRAILLYGPPGTGKTLLASAASNMLRATFFNVDIAGVLSRYVGDAPRMIDAIFTLAKDKSPSLLFFDEFDALAPRRELQTTTGTGLLQKLLTAIEGFKKGDSTFVLTIAGTNKPWFLDEAVLSRFEERIYVPLPDPRARTEIFRINLQKKGFEAEVNLEELAELTEGYSGREIAAVCRKAKRNMLRRLNPQIEELAERSESELLGHRLKIAAIRREEMMQAMEGIKPMVSKEMMSQFEEWRNEFGAE